MVTGEGLPDYPDSDRQLLLWLESMGYKRRDVGWVLPHVHPGPLPERVQSALSLIANGVPPDPHPAQEQVIVRRYVFSVPTPAVALVLGFLAALIVGSVVVAVLEALGYPV